MEDENIELPSQSVKSGLASVGSNSRDSSIFSRFMDKNTKEENADETRGRSDGLGYICKYTPLSITNKKSILEEILQTN